MPYPTTTHDVGPTTRVGHPYAIGNGASPLQHNMEDTPTRSPPRHIPQRPYDVGPTMRVGHQQAVGNGASRRLAPTP